MKLLGLKHRRKEEMLCDECFNLMERYSKLKNDWEFASKLDIKAIDDRVLGYFKQYPNLAQLECKTQIPLVLFCVECGLIDSVKWYINQGKNLNIKDNQTDNIALYAYKFDIPELVQYCAGIKELASYENKNGISLEYLLERDRKMLEVKERTKLKAVVRNQCGFKEMNCFV